MTNLCQKCKTNENVQTLKVLGRLLSYCEPCFAEYAKESAKATNTTMPVLEHYFTTPTADQGGGLDEAVTYGKSKPWDLVSIFWTHKNDAGHHCFTINYMPKINSNASVDGMD
jgi:hypothetical protein